MKNKVYLFFLLLLSVVNSSIAAASVDKAYLDLPLYFIENQGQLDKSVKFYEKGPGHTIFFTEEGIFFNLDNKHSIKLTPISMRRDVKITPRDQQEGKINYLIGDDPKNWHSNISTYKAILYEEAYPGIDLKFYGTGQQLEYDIIVKPGARPNHVRFRYEGITGLEITKDGDLVINSAGGKSLAQKKPIIYQEINGKRVIIEGNFKTDKDSYAFEIAQYNKKYPLIIDPTLAWATYLGGSYSDTSSGVAIDSLGYVYITGSTQSPDFPLKNPYDPSHNGDDDIFVSKINPNGTSLVYSTIIGGKGLDMSRGIAVDKFSQAHIVGTTYSDDIPGAHPWTGGSGDIYFAIISQYGTGIVSSFTAGGASEDRGSDIAVDDYGNSYITGTTSSKSFGGPQELWINNPIFPELRGTSDAFVAKIDITGKKFVYSTYLGGDGGEEGRGIAVTSAGAAWVCGATNSSNFPTTSSAPYKYKRAGRDAFVTEIDITGTGLIHSTYVGGDGNDRAFDIAVDSNKNVYITGSTDSPIFFPIKNGFQPQYGGGEYDAFLVKLMDEDLWNLKLVYSTFLGGSYRDIGRAVAVDNTGNVYITGDSTSQDFPLKNSFNQKNGIYPEAFLTNLKNDGSLNYSTFIGETVYSSYGSDVALRYWDVYVSGGAFGNDFLTTPNVIQPDFAGVADAFVAKISQIFWFPGFLVYYKYHYYGFIPAVVFSDEFFDATQIDIATIRMAGARAMPVTYSVDINGDNYLDLVIFFRTCDIRFSREKGRQTTLILRGQTLSGEYIRGVDTIRTAPRRNRRRKRPVR